MLNYYASFICLIYSGCAAESVEFIPTLWIFYH